MKKNPGVLKIRRRFASRRNSVFLGARRLGQKVIDIIIKRHGDENDTRREYEILHGLHAAGLRVPRPYGFIRNVLFMEYIPGILLTELVEKQEVPAAEWTGRLADWFYSFHRLPAGRDGVCHNKHDVNLRNFIYSDGRFYGIDFEAEERGTPERDLGRVSAYILADRPAFTREKYAAVIRFINQARRLDQKLSPYEAERHMAEEMAAILERRKTGIKPD
jgi:aminoglycoside phosphotransferase (APT) family kinase protein